MLGTVLAGILAHELALIAFALAGWRMRPRADARTFTIHRRSDWNVAAVGLGLLVVVEAVPVHFAAMDKSPAIAWVLSALSLYALLWLIGDYQALRLRPCVLEEDALRVRVGMRWKVQIPRAAIASLAPVRGNPPGRRERGYLRATVFGDPALLLELTAPVTAIGPYGLTRTVRRIGLSPDDPQALTTARAATPA